MDGAVKKVRVILDRIIETARVVEVDGVEIQLALLLVVRELILFKKVEQFLKDVGIDAIIIRTETGSSYAAKTPQKANVPCVGIIHVWLVEITPRRRCVAFELVVSA